MSLSEHTKKFITNPSHGGSISNIIETLREKEYKAVESLRQAKGAIDDYDRGKADAFKEAIKMFKPKNSTEEPLVIE